MYNTFLLDYKCIRFHILVKCILYKKVWFYSKKVFIQMSVLKSECVVVQIEFLPTEVHKLFQFRSFKVKLIIVKLRYFRSNSVSYPSFNL